MAPHKALKVSASSIAQQAVEAQATVQRGAASAGADLEGLVAQEEAPRAAIEQTEEEGPTPRIVETHESNGAGAPPVAEATGIKVEAPGTSEAEVVEASAAGPVA